MIGGVSAYYEHDCARFARKSFPNLVVEVRTQTPTFRPAILCLAGYSLNLVDSMKFDHKIYVLRMCERVVKVRDQSGGE